MSWGVGGAALSTSRPRPAPARSEPPLNSHPWPPHDTAPPATALEPVQPIANIRRKTLDIRTLRLSPAEGFVLSRLDAPLSIDQLVALTGLDAGSVESIVETLASQGAIDVDRPAPHASGESSTREYQRLYETVFQGMDRDQRIARAQTTPDAAELFALCLDPEPQVIAAVLSNPRSGLAQGRMIAQHHHTHAGLDQVGRRNELVSDQQVQRRLLVNPQLPDALLRRIVNSKQLADVYKLSVDHDLPERSRVMTRELLTRKFMLASPDERAALLVKTDGRCLVTLVNCALDARTTQLLTAKTSYTTLFIQHLARWTATPPALLKHLLKQPVVRQNMGLRKLLLKHPNVPADTKRLLS